MKARRIIITLLSMVLLCGCALDDGGKPIEPSEPTSHIEPTTPSEPTIPSEPTVPSEPTQTDTGDKTKLNYVYKDYIDNQVYELSAAPSVGACHILVIPVWFSDSSNYVLESNRDTIREDIRKAYFGTSSETGWHSVKSFYETESMGRLSFTGVVSDWYEVSKNTKAFGPANSGLSNTESLVTSATNWYFRNNPDSSRKDFDKDGDGYLDSVMFIYAAPEYDSLSKIDSSFANSSNLWAYCYWLQDPSLRSKSSPGPNVFFWASYDFMYGKNNATSKTGKSSCYYGDDTVCNPDAHTYIHEMGHVFGLDDYYDYSNNSYAPAGGFSMQDYNIGSHDPFSIISLGWADPYIPTESCSINLSPFQNNHEVILLTPSWNNNNSPFDEYFLIEFYSPTGLNKLDCEYNYLNVLKGPSNYGIRLWHVDARLLHTMEADREGNPIWSADKMTTDPTLEEFLYIAFSNSYNADYGSVLGRSYYDYNLLQLIKNNKKGSYRDDEPIKNSDLFYDGDSFNMDSFKSQFVKGNKMNSGLDLGWSFTVSITGSNENSVATINLIKQ